MPNSQELDHSNLLERRSQSDDPFLDPTSGADKDVKASGLSPVASAFTPGRFGPSTSTGGQTQENFNTSSAFTPESDTSSAVIVSPIRQDYGPFTTIAASNVSAAGSPIGSGSFTSNLEIQRAFLVETEFPLIDRIRRMIDVSS